MATNQAFLIFYSPEGLIIQSDDPVFDLRKAQSMLVIALKTEAYPFVRDLFLRVRIRLSDSLGALCLKSFASTVRPKID
jgi:hypothetical protein